jgi:hypothetical protein
VSFLRDIPIINTQTYGVRKDGFTAQIKQDAVALRAGQGKGTRMITSLSQKASLRRSGYYKLGAGFGVLLFDFLLVSLIGWRLPASMHLFDNVILLMFMIVPIVLLWGAMDYMASKGYMRVSGVLILFGAVGAIVMVVLPDKNRVC